jgi:hypothetical protein
MGTLSVGIVLEAVNAVRQKRDVPIVRRKVPAELVVRESTRQVSK